HHDAQKLIHTGLPLSEESVIGRPVYRSFKAKSGTSWPTFGPVPSPVMSAPAFVMGYEVPTAIAPVPEARICRSQIAAEKISTRPIAAARKASLRPGVLKGPRARGRPCVAWSSPVFWLSLLPSA